MSGSDELSYFETNVRSSKQFLY